MSNYPHPIIAREGWLYTSLAVVVAVLATLFLGAWSIPFWIVAAFVLQFFRDPAREIPQGEGVVLCPADGRVIVVGSRGSVGACRANPTTSNRRPSSSKSPPERSCCRCRSSRSRR